MSLLNRCPDCECLIGHYHLANCSVGKDKFNGHLGSEVITEEDLVERDYAPLRAVLDMAYEQSSAGKGKERHANQKPFDEQPILELSRMVGLGGPSFQAMKKIQEANGMHKRGDNEAAVRELLGAIVYAAAGVVLLQSEK